MDCFGTAQPRIRTWSQQVAPKVTSTSETTTAPTRTGDFVTPSEVGEVRAGNPLPIGGAHQQENGVNFVLFSRNATGVRLEFYQNSADSSPSRVIEFDPVRH